MSTSLPLPAENPSTDRINSDLVCLHCGYNLRGVALGGACPECGTAVRTTLRDDRIAEAPPAHLRFIQRGVTVMFVGTLLTPVLLYLGLVPATVGAWMLTARQPNREAPAKDERLRWAARLLMLVGTLILVGLSAYPLWLLVTDTRSVFQAMRDWQYVDMAFIAGNAAFWMGLLFLGQYVATLAERIPDESLQQACNRFRRVWIAGLGGVVAIGLAASAANWAYTALNVYYPWATGVFAAAIAVLLVALWIATLRFLWRLRRALSHA